MRPVAITGIGLVSPLGVGLEANREALLAGRSGLLPCADRQLAAMGVPGVGTVPAQTATGLDRVESLALDAARLALADADLAAAELPERTCLHLSTSKGPVATIEHLLAGRGAATPLPLWDLAPGSAGAVVARELRICGATACFPAACATGLVSVLSAAREVAAGRAELALAGASEASLTPFIHAGFLRMGALATGEKDEGGRMKDEERNIHKSVLPHSSFILHPSALVRPFDRNRSGFLLGEGAAVFVIESRERAAERRARVRALLAGGASACDAYDLAAPEPDGTGLAQAAGLALAQAGCGAEDIDAIWLHGTATRAGDEAELRAVSRLLAGASRPTPIPATATATKGLTGHLLGASGAVELALAALCLEAGALPAVANLEQPLEAGPELQLLRSPIRVSPLRNCLVLSAGFGGHSAAGLLRRTG